MDDEKPYPRSVELNWEKDTNEPIEELQPKVPELIRNTFLQVSISGGSREGGAWILLEPKKIGARNPRKARVRTENRKRVKVAHTYTEKKRRFAVLPALSLS